MSEITLVEAVTQALAHSDALMAAYRGTVRSPRAREFIDRALDEFMGVGHEGHHSMPGTHPAGSRGKIKGSESLIPKSRGQSR